MHVHVDGAGQDVQAAGVERLARRRHGVVAPTASDRAVLDRDAGRDDAVRRHDVAAVDDEIGRAHRMASSSQHGPAAVDRQVDAGDLARHVAGQEQAGVGDVAVAS